MTDEELITRLRDLGTRSAWLAADRIEALVKADRAQVEVVERQAETIIRINARAERLEAALREIESNDVHSGGEIHGVTALQWELAFAHAQDVASGALGEIDNEE